jgi:ABC-type nickel/cobalt efflux system permease component RcnA
MSREASAAASGPTQPSIEVRGSLRPNAQASRRDAFTELIAMPQMSAGLLLFAALVAAALGAVHALEPGHGKTVVAAYLVGSRGTARHALLLGLVVTASHTAGVYLLGAVTLYASRYVVPDRLYPWLGALSGVMIAGLGLAVFARRARGHDRGHDHGHVHEAGAHVHGHSHDHHHHHHHAHVHGHAVSLRELLALGITGGIVPCPAALVVLLSAVALGRIGFGLFLIVAFSVGLAAVLITIGVLMVYARALMTRVHGEGAVVGRWLPMASSAVVTLLGVAIALQALTAGGIVHLPLG